MNIKLKIKDAAEFLGRKGRRINLIFFGLILVFVTFTPIFIHSYAEYFSYLLIDYLLESEIIAPLNEKTLVHIVYLVAFIFAMIFLILVTCPIYYSFFAYSYQTYRNGIAGKAQFFNISTYGYLNYLSWGIVIFSAFAICFVPLIIMVSCVQRLILSVDDRISTLIEYLFIFIIAAGLVIGFLIFLLLRPLFLFVHYSLRGENFDKAVVLSIRRMRSPRAKRLYKEYIKAFLPSLILSVVTIVVLFLLDTLPKMTLVYFEVADEIVYGEEK